jgi:GntR family transcriptional repressor for pyruvate dehydrogenase complex
MHAQDIAPLDAPSLKARCVEALERLVISGAYRVGEALPPERDLAKRLGVSRPVVHEAMVELASKGFVLVEPRRGSRVNDFYRGGTLAIFESLIGHGGDISGEALADVLALRALIEIETARLAAERGGGEELPELRAILAEEIDLARNETVAESVLEAAALDFRFHFLVAGASGNRVYPLVINTFRPVYRILSERFYVALPDRAEVQAFHARLVDAIEARDIGGAAAAMARMLEHGARVLAVR